MAKERKTVKEKFSHEAMAYLDHLYRVAFHLVKESDEAQDLVQETYARALDSFEQFAAGSNLKAWLTRILYNFFFDRYHQKKRWISLDAGSSDETISDYWGTISAGNPGPEGHVLLKELSTKITVALKRLPEEFRLPILLVDMSDFSYAEAAETLSCPVGTVRSRLSRARRLLYNQLKEYVDPQDDPRTTK